MKTCFNLLAIIALISAPSMLMAQKITSHFVPFSPGKPLFREIGKSDLRILPPPAAQQGLRSPFGNHLPLAQSGTKRKLFIEKVRAAPSYHYIMPVVKPGKTSKILVAELDPNSPYTYNMPVKKIGVAEK